MQLAPPRFQVSGSEFGLAAVTLICCPASIVMEVEDKLASPAPGYPPDEQARSMPTKNVAIAINPKRVSEPGDFLPPSQRRLRSLIIAWQASCLLLVMATRFNRIWLSESGRSLVLLVGHLLSHRSGIKEVEDKIVDSTKWAFQYANSASV